MRRRRRVRVSVVMTRLLPASGLVAVTGMMVIACVSLVMNVALGTLGLRFGRLPMAARRLRRR